MRTLNLGILAHVDAGKTSLTERLLFSAGVIDTIGSVDAGSTQTDSLALERQRGITIKSAVVSFVINDTTVNLIDTPGHPDFIAEVERVLGVLDGVVLVISAVEGVQAQTRILMRTLQRLRIPTLLFVNKIDRGGAQHESLLRSIRARLTPAIVSMGATRDLGTGSADFLPYGPANEGFVGALAEIMAEHDDRLLAAFVAPDQRVPFDRLRRELAAQTGRALVHPVFFGSAITGAGVPALVGGITGLLPSAEGDAAAPASGTVFTVERGPAGERIAFVRLFTGTVSTRDRLRFHDGSERKVTAISLFALGSVCPVGSFVAGSIAKLWGLGDVQIGDGFGGAATARSGGQFAPPALETVVSPRRLEDRGALYAALAQLAEQDPLINLRQDDERQELSISLYGEVQKEVIGTTLAADFGIEVDFRETTTICIERPAGIGAAAEIMRVAPNPFLATVGLRIEPAAHGAGVVFQFASEVLGTMPAAFFKAVEESVHETLRQGVHGWQVTDCVVTMTHSGYAPRRSHAHQGFSKAMSSTGEDFRNLTPLVVMAALQAAGTVVFEPIYRFQLEIPADTFGTVAAALARLDGLLGEQDLRGATYVLTGEVPAARVHDLQQQLPGLTRGEGVLEAAFDSYEPVRGAIPTRTRSDHNPANRKAYLLHVQRQV